MWKYFSGSLIVTFIGLLLAGFVGWEYQANSSAVIQSIFLAAVLAVLEVSLSFDNAVVNAVVLKKMTPVWQRRFLTWGMLIAVFGMRLFFPLAIVAILGRINPWEALVLASTQPDQYAQIMKSAHLEIAAFGGSFLMLVALKFFYDQNKTEHWISWLENPVAFLGKIEAIEIAITLGFLVLIQAFLPNDSKQSFLIMGIAGILCFVVVDGIGVLLEASEEQMMDAHRASFGMFLYLEVLDASFSFDGVIGALALTHNIFIIMIGLSIGAFFVRSLTIYFVEKDTLKNFTYLEHGAFYAIGSLALIMLFDNFLHFPEWLTGLIGAVLIGLSFWSSLKAKKSIG